MSYRSNLTNVKVSICNPFDLSKVKNLEENCETSNPRESDMETFSQESRCCDNSL